MSLRYRSFAKVNLHLQVVGRRRDGYHELRTVFQTIDLHDLLTVSDGQEGVELTVSGMELPADSSNLAFRAAAGYLERWAPGQSVHLHLEKRVPMGGGLGGGSSNAATVLLALRERFGVPATIAELWPVARALGADVPYFLVGGTALGIGRGDEVIALPELPEEELWVAVPPVSIATAAVFAVLPEIEPMPLAPEILALAAGVPSSLARLHGWNDLEPVVFSTYPEVAEVVTALLRRGAPWVRLSGSGACLFTPVWGELASAEIANELPPGTKLWQTRMLGRRAIAELRNV